jgi:hypothetical protein
MMYHDMLGAAYAATGQECSYGCLDVPRRLLRLGPSADLVCTSLEFFAPPAMTIPAYTVPTLSDLRHVCSANYSEETE